MKKEKQEEISLLPLVEKKEEECRKRLADAERKASQLVEEATMEAKRFIENRRSSVAEREAKRLKETAQAMEAEVLRKKEEEKKKLKLLEEELKKRLPLASKEILKMILTP